MPRSGNTLSSEPLRLPNRESYHTVAKHQHCASTHMTKQRGQAQFCVCGHAWALPSSKLFRRLVRHRPLQLRCQRWPGAAMSRCFGVWQHTERSDLASERGSRRRVDAKCDTPQSQSHKILHLAATVGFTSHTVRASPASFSCLRARRESPARGLLVKSTVYPTSSCMGWPQRAGVFRQPCCGSTSRA